MSSEQSGDYPHGNAIAEREPRTIHTMSMVDTAYPPSPNNQRRSPNPGHERTFRKASGIGTDALGSWSVGRVKNRSGAGYDASAKSPPTAPRAHQASPRSTLHGPPGR